MIGDGSHAAILPQEVARHARKAHVARIVRLVVVQPIRTGVRRVRLAGRPNFLLLEVEG